MHLSRKTMRGSCMIMHAKADAPADVVLMPITMALAEIPKYH
jgi:hypothetical protein